MHRKRMITLLVAFSLSTSALGGGLVAEAEQDAEIAVTVKAPDFSFNVWGGNITGNEFSYPAGSVTITGVTLHLEPVAYYSISASQPSYLFIGWDHSVSDNPEDPDMRVVRLGQFGTTSSNRKNAYFSLFKNYSSGGPSQAVIGSSQGLTDRRYFRTMELTTNLNGEIWLYNLGSDLHSPPETWIPAGKYRLRLMAGVYVP